MVAGGVIRNACLAAAFLAASGEDGGVLTTRLLLRAANRELAKLGRLTDNGE